jgi:hypothetical protein
MGVCESGTDCDSGVRPASPARTRSCAALAKCVLAASGCGVDTIGEENLWEMGVMAVALSREL